MISKIKLLVILSLSGCANHGINITDSKNTTQCTELGDVVGIKPPYGTYAGHGYTAMLESAYDAAKVKGANTLVIGNEYPRFIYAKTYKCL